MTTKKKHLDTSAHGQIIGLLAEGREKNPGILGFLPDGQPVRNRSVAAALGATCRQARVAMREMRRRGVLSAVRTADAAAVAHFAKPEDRRNPPHVWLYALS